METLPPGRAGAAGAGRSGCGSRGAIPSGADVRVIPSGARNRWAYVGAEISNRRRVGRSLVPLGMTSECYVLTRYPLTLSLLTSHFSLLSERPPLLPSAPAARPREPRACPADP